MERDKQNNTLTFADDKEFFDWAVVPSTIVSYTDSGVAYTDFDMTEDYRRAVSDNTRLIILDPASQIVKHQCVTFHSDSHAVQVYPSVDKSKYLTK